MIRRHLSLFRCVYLWHKPYSAPPSLVNMVTILCSLVSVNQPPKFNHHHFAFHLLRALATLAPPVVSSFVNFVALPTLEPVLEWILLSKAGWRRDRWFRIAQ